MEATAFALWPPYDIRKARSFPKRDDRVKLAMTKESRRVVGGHAPLRGALPTLRVGEKTWMPGQARA